MIAFLAVLTATAQVDCRNIGFELGNTSGWTASYGSVNDQNQQTVYGTEITALQSTLHFVTSTGNDPKISAIPMVAPGSTHSLRLGNTVQGGDYSRIKTNYLVTSDNTLFQYKFAVILQNTSENNQGNGPGNGGNASHEPYQKPGFNIQIFDSNGSALSCSNYDIQLQGKDAVNGFVASGDIQYRDWTTGAIDLRNYVGKSITIVVTAHGCTRQRHFGYAYFDAQCLKSEIRSTSSCPDADGYMTLAAPDGFGKYTWNNGQTTQYIRVKANVGDKYHVKLVPLASLDENCALQLDYTIPYKASATTVDSVICEGSGVVIGDTIYRTAGIFVRQVSKSNVCDSTVTLHLQVKPLAAFEQALAICDGDSLAVGDTLYKTSGDYIKVIARKGNCDSTVTTHLTVVELDLSVPSALSVVEGDSIQIITAVDPPGTTKFLWQSAATLSCADCPDPWAHPGNSTQYTVTASDPDQVCLRKEAVMLFVKPCGIYIPDAFSPNQDNQNELFFVKGDKCVNRVNDMVIYNRWGEVIFKKTNFVPSDPAYGWDGTYHGALAEPGTYPYKIRIELASGVHKSYAGTVNLFR